MRRKTRDIGLAAFRNDICCVFSKESVDDLDDVITAYDKHIAYYDKYAPEH